MVKWFSAPGCWFRPPVRRYQAHDHDGRRGLGPVLPSVYDTHVMTTMLNTRSLAVIPLAGGPMAAPPRPPVTPYSLLIDSLLLAGDRTPPATSPDPLRLYRLWAFLIPNVAAGSPRAGHGPQSPGTGGGRRGYGSTSAFRPLPTGSPSWDPPGTWSLPLPASAAARPRACVQTCVRPPLPGPVLRSCVLLPGSAGSLSWMSYMAH